MDQAKTFRTAAAQHNQDRSPSGWRYPEQLRALAIEYCQARRQQGRPYTEIASDLGINQLSLSRWLKNHDAQRRPALRPVVIKKPTHEEGNATLTIFTPSGLRIEGVQWEQALELLRTFS